MAVTVADFFAKADALPYKDLVTIIGDVGVVVIAPHPDDESLGCGGLLAMARDAGRTIHVIVVSDGTGSHPNSMSHPRDVLLALRESEAQAAVAALGLSRDDITFLRLSDRSVPSEGAAADAAIETIVTIARKTAASAMLVTWRRDPHCDHEASFILAREAARRLGDIILLEYPVWGHTLPADLDIESPPRGYRLDVTDVLARKCAAIAAHRSQTSNVIVDDPFGFSLPAAMIARFQRPFEIYLRSS